MNCGTTIKKFGKYTIGVPGKKRWRKRELRKKKKKCKT